MTDDDDLEQELQENLRLRRDLGAKAEAAIDTSLRIRRGFHRLGLFLAAIVFVIGLAVAGVDAVHLRVWEATSRDLPIVVGGALIGLVEIGLACLIVYGLVRAIGWVISGFMDG